MQTFSQQCKDKSPRMPTSVLLGEQMQPRTIFTSQAGRSGTAYKSLMRPDKRSMSLTRSGNAPTNERTMSEEELKKAPNIILVDKAG